jgi:hypothetical protein
MLDVAYTDQDLWTMATELQQRMTTREEECNRVLNSLTTNRNQNRSNDNNRNAQVNENTRTVERETVPLTPTAVPESRTSTLNSQTTRRCPVRDRKATKQHK